MEVRQRERGRTKKKARRLKGVEEKKKTRSSNRKSVITKKTIALKKKLAEEREGKEGVGAIANWCKGDDKKTEKVLQENAEKERENWAFMNGKKVQRSLVKGKE